MKQREALDEEFLEHHMYDDFGSDINEYFENFLSRANTLRGLIALCTYTDQIPPDDFCDEVADDIKNNCRMIFGSEVEAEFDEIIRVQKSRLILHPKILGFLE